jgi:hypothetical protein
MRSKRSRTLADALKDKVIEFVDSIDVTKLLDEARKKRPKQLVVETTAEDVTETRESPRSD